MLWDTHIHTYYSGDSSAVPEDMAYAAKHTGLSGICFTDHLDLDYPKEPELFLLDIPRYLEETRSIAQDASDTLENFTICTGIELGLQPHLAGRHQKLLREYDFDFVIGSSHVVHSIDPYYPEYYEGREESQAYLEYFSSILENILAFDDFDVYGHLDYVVRYGPNQNRFYSYQTYRDIIDEILKLLIGHGKGLEVNTGGFKYGLGHPNPTEEILKRYRELGGEILTIGSDAHKPEHVAYDFQKIPEILQEAGFRYYTVFRQRKPQFLPLP
ncbi:MAG: histidinol-phosphatase HisJ family protein [Lachnospiraceae bacterium]|nr:histidinol-phosphatase HisJ family protein [Lachnospiraceae bacterium]